MNDDFLNIDFGRHPMVPDVFLNRAHSSVARQLSVWLGVVLLI